MNTIYDPNPSDIRKMPLVMFFAVVLFGVVGPASFPDYWWLYGVAVVMTFFYALFMTYSIESYTFFVHGFLSVVIFLLAFTSSCFAHMLVVDDLGGSKSEGVIVGGGLLAVILLLYAGIYLGKMRSFPYLVTENRVSFLAANVAGKYAGLVAGLGTLVASFLIKIFSSLTINAIVSVGFFFCCIAMLIHSRHLIRGLRTLRIQQKTMPIPYTFMQIDDIRAARSRWWLSRLFKWVASWRKSPGA